MVVPDFDLWTPDGLIMSAAEPPTIEVLEESNPQRRTVLGVVLASPGEGSRDTQARVDRLLEYVEQRSFSLGVVLGARVNGRWVSGALLIESPGRLGAAFIPAGSARDGRRQATRMLLDRLPQHAWDHSVTLIQALLDQEARAESQLFAEAGFEHLAELIYLERTARGPGPTVRGSDALSFVTYSPQTHDLFVDVLTQTYQASLDCPKLSGIRRPEEVLATHRATGIHDPQGWYVVTRADHGAGVLLLAGVQDRPAFEIVYMGVVPQARASGIGDAILARAVDHCRRHGDADLTLAVDEDNEPARRLYQRWGMHETTRRSAWFTPNPQRCA